MTGPSRWTRAEGLFRKVYGARKAAMVLGRMSRPKAIVLAERMRQAGKVSRR